MRYVAAYLLATLGGNSNPSKDDITKILESVGLEIDQEKLDKVYSELNGKDINEVIADGMSKLASIPSGGVAVASGGGGASGGTAAATEEKEEKKEEKKEESEEESDDDMGFGLFD
jgi:large subunit ribosomal protein LP2